MALAVKKSNLSSFPGGIINGHINKYYSILEPSVKGYLTQEITCIQLLKISHLAEISPSSTSNDIFPTRVTYYNPHRLYNLLSVYQKNI